MNVNDARMSTPRATRRDDVVFADVYTWLVTPSAAGAALLVLLFQGSTPFTESITVGKYPEYKARGRPLGLVCVHSRLAGLNEAYSRFKFIDAVVHTISRTLVLYRYTM